MIAEYLVETLKAHTGGILLLVLANLHSTPDARHQERLLCF